LLKINKYYLITYRTSLEWIETRSKRQKRRDELERKSDTDMVLAVQALMEQGYAIGRSEEHEKVDTRDGIDNPHP